MSKAKNTLRSRVWRKMSPAAQQRHDAVQATERLRAIGLKAQAHIDREVKDVTDSRIGSAHGDRVVLDSTLIQREHLPVPNSPSMTVEELPDVTEEEFHRMMVIHDSADPFTEISDRMKRETLGPMVMSLVDGEAQRFLSTGHIQNAQVEEVNDDDAAALLYFSDRNNRA